MQEIEFNHVTMSYIGCKQPVFKNVSFKISVGQNVELIGEKGSGKSTILKLILGLYEPTSGEILINGENIKIIDKVEWRKSVGVVLQNSILANGSIFDNIRMKNQFISREQVIEAAKLADIHEYIESLPEKYNTQIVDFGFHMSEEQREKIALARILLEEKRFFMLDSVIEKLERVKREKVLNNIKQKEGTCLVVSNYKSVYTDADKTMRIKNGILLDCIE